MTHSFYSPTEFIFERDAVKYHAEKFASLGKKAMLVTTPSAARTTGALSDVTQALSAFSIPYEIFSEVEANPSYSTVKRAAELANSASCDFFIGIGGGSAMDSAKAAALIAANVDLSEEDIFSAKAENAPYPIAVVGTTAGTGSEVTHYSIITGSDGRKKNIKNINLLPRIAFGDTKYLAFMSDALLKTVALDAACHAFESYFNRLEDDFSSTFAIRALKLLIPEFETISAYGSEGLDDKDYEALYLASIYAGLAIEKTGTAMCHSLSYYLSESRNIPHGKACAVFLPAYLMHCSKWEPERSAALFDELCRTEEEMRTLISDLTQVPEISFTEDDLSAIRPRLSGNSSLSKCPGEVSPEYFEEIIKALFM